jgi:hypothetical protein
MVPDNSFTPHCQLANRRERGSLAKQTFAYGMLERMGESSKFMLQPHPWRPWIGGEPRVFAVDKEDKFPEGWPSIKDARFVDVQYKGGGITGFLENVAASCGVTPGSFQAILENLDDLSHEMPLVIVVRDADHLLADVGPAIIHLITGWEGFTHHASGVSAIYLVLETGPRAVTHSAFYPGGVVDWTKEGFVLQRRSDPYSK